MTIENLICGIIGSIIATMIISIITKIYIGGSNSNGVKSSIRLIRDCYEGGIANIFPSRKTYVQHKDHGTESQYISKCNNKVMYIGYWLAHGTEMGDIINEFEKLIISGKEVEVILLNPNNDSLVLTIADYMRIDSSEMKQRINNSLSKLCRLQKKLTRELAVHFSIKVHNIPINASAFMVDYDNNKEMRILVDYKTYNHEREKSYGIEFRNGEKILTRNLRESYLEISRKAKLWVKI